MKENRIILFSAGYNCKEWVKRHMERIQYQTYKNYIHIVVDDATTDGTYEEILKYKDENTVVYQNKKNMGWVYNAVMHIREHIKSPEDIIVGYDLDDWIAHDEVLKRLNEIYTEKDCWVTYGGFVRNKGFMEDVNWAGYPKEVIKNRSFRKYKWRFWAMRTFKAFMWNAINKNDFKDPKGEWPKTTYDYAIGFPLLEMCPPDKLYHIGQREALYIYNYSNLLQDKRVHQEEQVKLGRYYQKKKPYDILADKESGFSGNPEFILASRAKKQPGIEHIALPDKVPDGVKQSRIIIFSAGCNCKSFVKKHMESISMQRYNNYVHIIVDDASIDNTPAKLQKYQHKKMIIHRTKKNKKWLACATEYLARHVINEEDIIITVDLDDWLPHDGILEKINYAYKVTDCWLTYGSYRHHFSLAEALRCLNENEVLKGLLDVKQTRFNLEGKTKGKNKIHKQIKPKQPVAMEILKRKVARAKLVSDFSHLKTFKAFLWRGINKEDFKGPKGEYATCCYDRAIMYPMVEMCEPEKILFINEVLYIYNSSNPLCNVWSNREEQIYYEKVFQQKPVYEELDR